MGDVALYLVLLNFNRCVQVGKTLQNLLDLRFTLTKGVTPIYPICVVEHAERTGTARLRGARHLNNKFGQSQGSQHDELGFVMMEVRPLETMFFTGLTPPPLQQQGDPWSL